jgi:hypothetical protein
VRLLIVAMSRFIQMDMPLPPLKPMAQSRRGVTQGMEVQMHLLTKTTSMFIQVRELAFVSRCVYMFIISTPRII